MDLQAWLIGVRSVPWREVGDGAQLVLYYLAVFAVFGCLVRLGTIRAIIRDFREARGPLWDLRNTVSDLKDLEPVIRSLGSQVALIDEKVDAAHKQVAVLQVESVSNRTDAAEDGSDATPARTLAAGEDAEDRNWQMLQDCWRRNTQRIEYVIDQIEDGRTKVAYDRLPRTNYVRIINKLQGQKIITAAAANASRSLIEMFNSYRPRNRKVPDEVVGSLRVLDEQLDRELIAYSNVLAAEDATDSEPRQPDMPTILPSAAQQRQPNGQASDLKLSGHPTT
jgi:hypothetical protein